MDVMEAVVEEKADYTLFNLMYGFIALLAFCVLFSFGKAVYQFYKERAQLNVTPAEDNTITESQSNPSTSSIPDSQTHDHNRSDSDRLNMQLDKLRRLLNRLNAMGTFSRDTIGDISAPSTSYANNSRAPSSDMSNFWSSIDFDDFEESTITEDNFLKAPREQSISLSVSDFSLDVSGMQCGKFNRKNIATSSKKYTSDTVSSMLAPQRNPSDAIDQILVILDSIMTKDKNDTETVKNVTLKHEIKPDEMVYKDSSHSALSKSQTESFTSQEETIPSVSLINNNNITASSRETVNAQSTIRLSHKESKIPITEIVSLDTTLTAKSQLLIQNSEILNSPQEMFPSSTNEAKIVREINVDEFTPTKPSRPFYTKKLPCSSKYKQPIIITDSPSFSIGVESIIINSPPQQKKCSCSPIKKSLVSRESHSILDGISRKVPSETNIGIKGTYSEDLKKSHSLSNLVDNRISLLPVQPRFIKSPSFQNKFEISASNHEKVPSIVITIPDVSEESCHSPITSRILDKENEKWDSKMRINNNNNLRSVSSKDITSPLFADIVSLKSCISESEMKLASYLETLSPNMSSSVSISFLSPITIADLSPVEKIDWKSPVEPTPGTLLANNRPQHNEKSLSRCSYVWSTPPSPNADASDEGFAV